MKTIESFRRIFSSSVVTESFCRQCTRKIDEKNRCIIRKRVFKIRCILIDATEKHSLYFLDLLDRFWCYLQLYCILDLHLDY